MLEPARSGPIFGPVASASHWASERALLALERELTGIYII